MPEAWRKVEVPDPLRKLAKPFHAEVDALLTKWSGGNDEA